ncbi:methyltransferase [Nonlabens sp. Asnod3-A02]|uniref:methyltransferase n=1 Tax=Nonlabens sp. Asnod3-A02 TaxID=3160579 RepID=UPI003866694D
MTNKEFLKSFFTEHWKYMTVSAACKLNLFDSLDFIGKSSVQISELLNVPKQNLDLLLNGLVSINFLLKVDDRYTLSELSELLIGKHPETMKYACLNWSGDHLKAWMDLDKSIKTGKSFFQNNYGVNFFKYINEDNEKLDHYHNAMFAYAKDDYQNITDKIDFSHHKSIMDVGAGYGAAISQIKDSFPSLDCYLFDLPSVIDNCDIDNDIILKPGNFFDEIPKVSEAIILSRILHDWNDEKAHQILENTYDALPKSGYLYIIENCSDKIAADLSLLSLNMLAMCESFERTSYEYIAMANKSGFIFQKATALNDLQTILTFTRQ